MEARREKERPEKVGWKRERGRVERGQLQSEQVRGIEEQSLTVCFLDLKVFIMSIPRARETHITRSDMGALISIALPTKYANNNGDKVVAKYYMCC